jgi:hypothetical protein
VRASPLPRAGPNTAPALGPCPSSHTQARRCTRRPVYAHVVWCCAVVSLQAALRVRASAAMDEVRKLTKAGNAIKIILLISNVLVIVRNEPRCADSLQRAHTHARARTCGGGVATASSLASC